MTECTSGSEPAGGKFWPPRIVWSRERGWLKVRDPETGQWFSLPAKGAPSGWTRLAMAAKYDFDPARESVSPRRRIERLEP